MVITSEHTGGKSSNGIVTRALSRHRTGFSPDVLVVDNDEVLEEGKLVESSSFSKEQNQEPARNVVRNSLISGSLSGMASTVILYPMDFLRTNLQAAGMAAAPGNNTGNTGNTGNVTIKGARAGGPLQVLRQTIQSGGIQALYTGLALPLIAQAVYKGTVFTVNNILEEAILDFRNNRKDGSVLDDENKTQLSVADRSFCGFVAGAINGGLFVTPVEYVRNQLIAKQAKLSAESNVKGVAGRTGAVGTSLGVIRHAIHGNGIHTLWRGIGITMVRDGFGVAGFFSAMAMVKQFLTDTFPNECTDRAGQPSFLTRIVSGGSGGLAYWLVSLPLDTVKTWVQSADPSARVSPIQVIRQVYAQGGMSAVWSRLNRGWQVAYGRGIPSAAITIGVYSYSYQLLEQYDKNES